MCFTLACLLPRFACFLPLYSLNYGACCRELTVTRFVETTSLSPPVVTIWTKVHFPPPSRFYLSCMCFLFPLSFFFFFFFFFYLLSPRIWKWGIRLCPLHSSSLFWIDSPFAQNRIRIPLVLRVSSFPAEHPHDRGGQCPSPYPVLCLFRKKTFVPVRSDFLPSPYFAIAAKA